MLWPGPDGQMRALGNIAASCKQHSPACCNRLVIRAVACGACACHVICFYMVGPGAKASHASVSGNVYAKPPAKSVGVTGRLQLEPLGGPVAEMS